MSVIVRMRRQRAIWWQRTEADRYGKFSFAAPVEIACRWDDGGEEWRDTQGQIHSPMATVYVDREMANGDRLKKGELESDTPADPSALTDAFEITRFMINPNFRATENLYTAIL